jgi:anti-sigma B factor antagonist
MRIESEKTGDILKVKPLEKRIDASVSIDFRALMTAWIREGNRRIVLDLSLVEFVDSSGLGAIVSSLKAVTGEGDLVISGARGAVESLFRLTKMDRVFHLFGTDGEAVDYLRKLP